MTHLLAASWLISAPAAIQQAAPPELALRTVRFHRAELNQTRVSAFIEIPYVLLDPVGSGDDARLAYEVQVAIKDSTGLQLVNQSWSNHAPARLRQAGASGMEMFDFAVAPGRYTLDVTVRDSASGRSVSARTSFEGWVEAPAASDLLVAPMMRVASAGDTVPVPGEIRRGNTLIAASAVLRLTPLRTEAFYLLEAYADSQSTGRLTVSVLDSAGKALVQTRALTVAVAPGGSVLQGKIDLAGLPAGRYRMRADLAVDGDTVQRTAPLAMAGLEATLERDVARRERAKVADAGYFAALSPEELEDAKAPLMYVARSGELKVWDDELSLQAKRNFLTQFWQKRDPTPDTERNEAREAFYDAIAEANRLFGSDSPREQVPGWRTDRGRIFIKNGPYDDILRRQQQGSAPPYEVWRYTRGRPRYFIFVDRTALGNYNLVKTNDLNEPSLPTWERLVGDAQVDDISRFLGFDLRTSDGQ